MTRFTAHSQEITMRAATSLRLLLVPAALLGSACDDSSNPIAPEELPIAEAEAPGPEQTTGPQEDFANWADGYIWVATVDGKVVPVSNASFNRSGGAMTVTKVAGTTGRYVVRFKGLSGLLGGKSTVHVSGSNSKLGGGYCKPVGGFLVRDSVEVRCFRIGTGAATNADFQLSVLGKRDDRAFAFANQPTASNYAPASAGSWNPAGAIRVYRDGIGLYRVVFSGFGARLPAGSGGHVQVNAVAGNKVHCKTEEWGSSTDLVVTVACYTPAGARADAKFTTMVTPPAAHLAFVWADQPTLSSYNPHSFYSSNPVGGSVVVTRAQVGSYHVRWIGVDAEIRDFGNAQVTAWGFDNAQCQVGFLDAEGVSVQCFGPNGAAVDTYYSLLLGS
jgi:hypothetical protein